MQSQTRHQIGALPVCCKHTCTLIFGVFIGLFGSGDKNDKKRCTGCQMSQETCHVRKDKDVLGCMYVCMWQEGFTLLFLSAQLTRVCLGVCGVGAFGMYAVMFMILPVMCLSSFFTRCRFLYAQKPSCNLQIIILFLFLRVV